MLSRLSHSEQIRLIMTHPFFTGRCPNCRHRIQLAKASLGNCKCDHCGWLDQSQQPPPTELTPEDSSEENTLLGDKPKPGDGYVQGTAINASPKVNPLESPLNQPPETFPLLDLDPDAED